MEDTFMKSQVLRPPDVDPTPIFELFRGSYASELLTAATCHFDVFGRLSRERKTFSQLRDELELADRPANVLITALRAMGLLTLREDRLQLTSIAHEHLVPGGEFDVGNYVGLAAENPGVLQMVRLLKSNRPLGSDGADTAGTAFIYRDGNVSAMDAEQTARHFTMALAGRAKNVAPVLAEQVDCGRSHVVLDVAGGTGIYCYALLQKNPHLRGIIFDRPEVLKIAKSMAEQYGVTKRMEFVGGDMFVDRLPQDADVILLSNVLHDWDVAECRQLIGRCADVLPTGGRLMIHDVFLNDALDGPLPIALYSAALFTLTEGRAYSAGEYAHWLNESGLLVRPPVATLVHCGVMVAEQTS